MCTYRNTSERWGDAVGGLTVEDYMDQARKFDRDPDDICADAEGVYFRGEQIAEAEQR